MIWLVAIWLIFFALVSPPAASRVAGDDEPSGRKLKIVTSWRPHSPGQLRALTSTARIISVTCGRRWGKSAIARAWLTGIYPGARWGAVHVKGGRFGYFGPTRNPTCREFFDKLTRSLGSLVVESNKTDLMVRLFNGTTIESRSLELYENHRGLELDGLVIDEKGTVVADAWTHVLRPTIADPPERCIRRALLVGTPRGQKHWTYKEHMKGIRGEPGHEAFQFQTLDRPGMSSEVEEMRRDMPDMAFRQEVLAEFLADAAGYFQRIPEAHDGREPPTGPEPGAHYAAGLDFAHSIDYTVIAVIQARPRPMRLVAIERFPRTSFPLTKARAVEICRRWGCGITIDATPGGAPGDVAVEAFRPELTDVEGVDFNKDRERLLQELSLALEKRDLTLPGLYDKPAFPILTMELESFRTAVSIYGRGRGQKDRDGTDDAIMGTALALQRATHGMGGYGSRRHY